MCHILPSKTQIWTHLVCGDEKPRIDLGVLWGHQPQDPPFRPMSRTGNTADLIPSAASFLASCSANSTLPSSFSSCYSALCGEHMDTRGSLVVPAPGARKLSGIQGFTTAEAGQIFSAQDGLHTGAGNRIPYIPATTDAVCENLSEPRSQLTLFTDCVPLFTLCSTALPSPLSHLL